MSPTAQSDRHDDPWLLHEFVPGIAAVIEQVVVAEEDAIGEPVLADELPDAFLRIEFGALGRQRDEADVGWHDKLRRHVPSSLVKQQHSVPGGLDLGGNCRELQAHRLGVAPGQDQADSLAMLGANGAEDRR